MRAIKSDYFSDMAVQKFECTFCDTKFTRISSLRRHLLERCRVQLIPASELECFMKENHGARAQDYFKIQKH